MASGICARTSINALAPAAVYAQVVLARARSGHSSQQGAATLGSCIFNVRSRVSPANGRRLAAEFYRPRELELCARGRLDLNHGPPRTFGRTHAVRWKRTMPSSTIVIELRAETGTHSAEVLGAEKRIPGCLDESCGECHRWPMPAGGILTAEFALGRWGPTDPGLGM